MGAVAVLRRRHNNLSGSGDLGGVPVESAKVNVNLLRVRRMVVVFDEVPGSTLNSTAGEGGSGQWRRHVSMHDGQLLGCDENWLRMSRSKAKGH